MDVNEEKRFCENSKKNLGGGWGGCRVRGGQDGCERRIEVFMKIHKKNGGGGSGGSGGGSGWM